MIRAYDKVYLEKAQTVLARMLDYAVCERGYDLNEFFELFLSSGIAKRFGDGDYRLLAGMSGVELFHEVLELSGLEVKRIKPVYAAERSREYWTGWALAYYQWYSGLSFERIRKTAAASQIRDMYTPFHEMDIRQFCDELDLRIFDGERETRLKAYRRLAGISQKELSALSGVPLRMLQEYEQGRKNIGRAQAEYVIRIASVLGCEAGDLLA